MKKRNTLIIALGLSFTLVIGAALCAGGRTGQAALAPRPAPAVGVYTVKSETVTLTTELPGRVAARRIAEVRPQVGGLVKSRLYEEGALVAEGQVLYQIDEASYQAAYDKAMAQLDNAAKAARRQESLKDKAALSAQDYENALYAWRQAQAEAELARLNLEHCRVTAPISGRIGRSAITEGALVTAGQAQALAVIQQVDPIYVDLSPAVSQILKIDGQARGGELDTSFFQGAEVTLTMEDGRAYPLTGRIKFLDNAVDQGTGSVALRAEFDNPEGRLIPGMFVRAQVAEGVKNAATLVPQQALVRDAAGRATVWVVGENNLAEKREVTAERTIGNTWLVTSGLAEGERVVTEGLQNLSEGLAVVAREASNVKIRLAWNQGRGGAAEEARL